MAEHIIYAGSYFTVEWYYDRSGESDACQFYFDLNTKERQRAMALFKRMADAGEIKDITKFRNEGDGIYAFKPQPDRFLCFFTRGKRIIITSGFRKTTEKLPVQEKKRAQNRRDDYENRVQEGTYYEGDL